jgi:SpoVK/Ycf46/Vps4 family AAA+-type ATPase
VCLSDEQAIEILKMVELFRNNDPAKPQGLLLKGVPGTGKTLLASVVAELLGCNFVRASLADLKHPHLGQSGQLVRALWKDAREKSPSVIFVDECESVFGKRGAAETDVVATDVVQTFLSEWNGKDKDVWIIGATNRRDMLDEAIVSRFDRELEISLPNEELRAEILRREMNEVGVDGAIPDEVGNLTQGMSGRDLAQLAKKVRALAHPRSPQAQDFIAAIHSARGAGNTPVDREASWDTLIVDAHTLDKLQTVCALLRDPEGWRKQGVTIPSGLLLVGPPGTGKTEVARTIANESGLAFFGVTTGDVKGPYVGHSVNRVKNLFERARSSAPAIIFLDELDIVAPTRTEGQHDTAQEEIVGQLLQEINGIRRQDSHVFLLAATNHSERVDPAILSRLQEQIEIPLPDDGCRARFIRLVLDGKKKTFPIEYACDVLVSQSAGMSKRDIGNWVARAEQKAIRRATALGGPEHFSLTMEDFVEQQVASV